jgi:hypothetical protein
VSQVAAKTGSELSTKELEELIENVDKTMDRLKTLYEQYFLGIQKQAPSFIHNDVERKLRDLTQMNIRNTGLRYRLATMQQKFGSYNSYWRRTLRQIENGTYARNLAKIGREAARKGADIPEEILAAMPKRMREQVLKDRDAAIEIARRRTLVDGDALTGDPDYEEAEAHQHQQHRDTKTSTGAHMLSDDDDLDFDSLFAAFNDEPAAKPATQEITRPIPKAPSRPHTPTAQPTMAMPKFNRADTEPDLPPEAIETTAIPRPPVPRADPLAPTQAMPRVPIPGQPQTQSIPVQATGPIPQQTGQIPIPGQTGAMPRVPGPTGAMPRVPAPGQPPTGAVPRIPAPSQASRPNPIAPGSASASGPTSVESMNGPFPRPDRPAAPPSRPTPVPQRPTPPPSAPRPAAPAPMRPPPGMTEKDVNDLHAKYVQAKQAVGEKVDASSREKLLRTINQTAPKIMEQYKASGVDFQVVVKDNQVVIKAKPKT